jgi:signal transduction histidine kinase
MSTEDVDNLPKTKDTKVLEQELRAQIAEQETKLLSIVERVARIRHEINNPLTGVIGQAQLLLREPDLPATARRRAETIEQLAGRIRDTVAELRDVQLPNNEVSYEDSEVNASDKRRE